MKLRITNDTIFTKSLAKFTKENRKTARTVPKNTQKANDGQPFVVSVYFCFVFIICLHECLQ
jgi:hypothetical protein